MAVSRHELIEMLRAYKALERILSTKVRPAELYKPGFVKGLNTALRQVRNGKTKPVGSFRQFIS